MVLVFVCNSQVIPPPTPLFSLFPSEQKKVLKAARIVSGILDEPFGAHFEADALEPWQQRVLVELRLDGPRADLSVHLGGDSTRGRLPVRSTGCAKTTCGIEAEGTRGKRYGGRR